MATTLQDIADAVGVSKVTVSKVLRGKVKGSWPKSAQRVQQIRETAERMGYQVDWRAKALQSGRTQMIGLLSTSRPETDTHDPELVAGLIEAFGKAGYHVVFYRIHSHAEHTGFADARFDGVIIDYHIEPEEIALIQRAKLPAVIVNAPSAQGIPSVMPKHQDIGRIGANHLLELGHKRIGYIQSPACEKGLWPQHMFRFWKRGIVAAMKHAGHEDGYIDIVPTDDTELVGPETFAKQLVELTKGPNRPTALIVNGPERAVELVVNNIAPTGLKIPDDLSVLSMGDMRQLDWSSPSVTGIDINFNDLGRRAAVALLKQIEPTNPVLGELEVDNANEATLNQRASTAPPRRG